MSGEHTVPRFFDAVSKTESADASQNQTGPEQADIDDAEGPRAGAETGAELPTPVRQALSLLVTKGVLLRDEKPELFAALRLHEDEANHFFAHIFMQLSINPSAGLAIIQPEDTEIEHNPLVRRRSLPLYESIVLVQLRKFYQEQVLGGAQQISIEIEQIEQLIHPFLPLAISETWDRSKLKGAIKRLSEHRILRTVRNREDTYAITPVIQHVVKGDMLAEFVAKYRELAENKEIELGEAVDD